MQGYREELTLWPQQQLLSRLGSAEKLLSVVGSRGISPVPCEIKTGRQKICLLGASEQSCGLQASTLEGKEPGPWE